MISQTRKYIKAKLQKKKELKVGMNDSRPARLNIAPVLHINRVHLSKVIHIRQEDVDLNHLGDIGTGLLEDVGQVLDTLVLEWKRSC
jgi:hypothetical protein